MSKLFILVAIVVIFLYYRRNKVVVASNLPEISQYIRLWIIPIFQLIICAIVLFGSYIEIELLSRKSPFMDQLLKDNLGIFSSISSDVFNDYRTEKLTPFLEQANNVHKYAIYLFYGSIASLVFHIIVLKNKICSKQTVFGFAILLTVAILMLDYYYLYNSSKSFSAFASTETLGLFGLFAKNENETIESAISSVCELGIILFFIHYYHNIWLRQYYREFDEANLTPDILSIDTDSSAKQSDKDKYQNLKDLKALLDAGILTQEEFDQQKKEIFNS